MKKQSKKWSKLSFKSPFTCCLAISASLTAASLAAAASFETKSFAAGEVFVTGVVVAEPLAVVSSDASLTVTVASLAGFGAIFDTIRYHRGGGGNKICIH